MEAEKKTDTGSSEVVGWPVRYYHHLSEKLGELGCAAEAKLFSRSVASGSIPYSPFAVHRKRRRSRAFFRTPECRISEAANVVGPNFPRANLQKRADMLPGEGVSLFSESAKVTLLVFVGPLLFVSCVSIVLWKCYHVEPTTLLPLLALFSGLVFLWGGVKESVQGRLDYLNEKAFSPFLEICSLKNQCLVSAEDADKIKHVLKILKESGRYLPFTLYPKRLLSLGEAISIDGKEYDLLWQKVKDEFTKWTRDNAWALKALGGTADMDVLNSIVGSPFGISRDQHRYSTEAISACHAFLDVYRKDHGEDLSKFAELHEKLLKSTSAAKELLAEHMQTNLLGATPTVITG